jgi:hypothetical protein
VNALARLMVRFAPDDPVWAALRAIPPGQRSQVTREALRLMLLGPTIIRDMATALALVPAVNTLPPAPPPPAAARQNEDFLSAFDG